MNIIFVWVVAGILLFGTATVWMLMTPVYKIMVNTLNSTMHGMAVMTSADLTATDRVFGTLNLGFLVLPAGVILAIVIWAFMSSQRRDYETDVYNK